MIGKVFAISGKKIFTWYRNHISGYTNSEVQKELHKYDTVDGDIIDKKTGEMKTVPVPILAPEHLGKDMAVDDKNLNGEGYTIISNKITKKIFLMIQTRKAKIIQKLILDNVPLKLLLKVRSITKDLAEGYDWVARACFMNAQRIADKFHVIKMGLEALQAIRIRLRQARLTAEREAKEKGKKLKKIILTNGETIKELLARSRYLLFKFESDWTDTQRERAAILFELYPEIYTAYKLICSFRAFYKIKIGNKAKAKNSLQKWYQKVHESGIDEIKNFASTVKNHEGQILAYFDEGHTNAFAESLNAKLQRFIIASYGFNDKDFFHFRIKNHFT